MINNYGGIKIFDNRRGPLWLHTGRLITHIAHDSRGSFRASRRSLACWHPWLSANARCSSVLNPCFLHLVCRTRFSPKYKGHVDCILQRLWYLCSIEKIPCQRILIILLYFLWWHLRTNSITWFGQENWSYSTFTPIIREIVPDDI